jgi:LPS-assembly protein
MTWEKLNSAAEAWSSRRAPLGIVLFLLASLLIPAASAQQIHLPAVKGGIAELSSSGPQRRQGDLYIAEDDVDLHYVDWRLRADYAEYNARTSDAFVRGHVQFDYGTQHLEADEAHFNVSTGRGTFRNVRGTIQIERRPNPAILVSDNPLYFEAQNVERLPGDVYVISRAWITICDPQHPKWQFFAPQARVRLNKTVALVSANFRLFRVPLVWLPYATAPAGTKIRQSGFLIPELGDSTRKGVTIGDSFYWAPKPWLDTTFGLEYLSLRGVAEHGSFRAKPFKDTSISYLYFGVEDRGLPDEANVRHPQGGEQQRLEIRSLLPGGWRFVTDYNHLSSLTFRLAFANTFGEAINAEVRSAGFLTNNFRGFSLNFAAINDKNFLTITPPTTVTLRSLPEMRFGSLEQSPFRRLPVYFAFDSFVGAQHRSEAENDTSSLVSRFEFAPRMTVPVHLGRWLGVTATAGFRTTRYGDSLDAVGEDSSHAIMRNTGEFSVDLRPPTLERFFTRPGANKRYKHSIEPTITYRYVTGVNNFGNFIRFDSDATLSNTTEVEYGVTQRFFVKEGDAQAQELISWRIAQKHYFDPTFGGAIVPGTRNVLQALDSITPFAFALGPVHWSPVVSDFKLTPGGRYDAEQILEYDPTLEKITAMGTLLKIKPYKEFFTTIAHFNLQATPGLQPLANQIRALAGYGGDNRKGFNFTTGISYDFRNSALQNQLIRVGYNGGCCGLAVEYRRIVLGAVRSENQFRVAFIIANIGAFGNLRHEEHIF